MIKIKIGFTVCICDDSHSMPKRCRSIDSAWLIQDEKFCCQSAQKIATKGTGIKMLRMILPVCLLKISRAYVRKPTGGMCTNFLRPAQKMIVAIAMKMPGNPNAISGLCKRGLSRKATVDGGSFAMTPFGSAWYGSKSQGISSVEMAEPALIEK